MTRGLDQELGFAGSLTCKAYQVQQGSLPSSLSLDFLSHHSARLSITIMLACCCSWNMSGILDLNVLKNCSFFLSGIYFPHTVTPIRFYSRVTQLTISLQANIECHLRQVDGSVLLKAFCLKYLSLSLLISTERKKSLG